MSTNFSIILASRGRPALLSHCLDCIHQRTNDPENLEVLTVADEDDVDTIRTLKHLPYPWLKPLTRPRSTYLNESYLNWAARLSTGKFLLFINDDAEISTDAWDELALTALTNLPTDRIVYGRVNDGVTIAYKLGDYSCFPLLTREVANALGWFMPPYFASHQADPYLHRLFQEVHRVMDVPVLVQHLIYYTNKRQADDTNIHTLTIAHRRYAQPNYEADRQKLFDYISKHEHSSTA